MTASSVQEPSSTSQILPQTCPLCARPATSAVERVVRTIFLGDYMCAEGHVWMLKTVTGQ